MPERFDDAWMLGEVKHVDAIEIWHKDNHTPFNVSYVLLRILFKVSGPNQCQGKKQLTHLSPVLVASPAQRASKCKALLEVPDDCSHSVSRLTTGNEDCGAV